MSRFFMDTDNELWYTYAEELGVDVIRMPYNIDGEEKLDNLGRDINFEEFYEKLRNGSTAKTSALNVQNYLDYFEPVFAAGEDIVYLHFSSEMSGTFNQMRIAVEELKEKYPERKFTAIDSLTISVGGGLMTYDVATMWKNGATDEELAQYVEKHRSNYALYFLVDTLSFLKKGGRISAVSFVAGTLLNIKPILTVGNDGKIVKHTTATGLKKGVRELFNLIKTKGTEFGKHPIIIAQADAEEAANELKNMIHSELGENINVIIQKIGPTIVTHSGPGTIGVAFYATER